MFLGRDMGHQRDYSEELAEKVDAEVRALIEQAHDEAWQVLNDNRDILDQLASELLEKETLDHDQLAEIFADVEEAARAPAVALERRRVRSATARRSRSRRRRRSTPELVDGGVDSEPPAKPKRTPRPRKTPGIATA